MKKNRKALSTKKPPEAVEDHKILKEWMANRIMPGIKPLIERIDKLIHDEIPDLHYAVKWSSAFYGTKELGWLIQIAAYDVSANIVFLNGAAFDPQPPLGEGDESRYIKLRSQDELEELRVVDFIKQAGGLEGWK